MGHPRAIRNSLPAAYVKRVLESTRAPVVATIEGSVDLPLYPDADLPPLE